MPLSLGAGQTAARSRSPATHPIRTFVPLPAGAAGGFRASGGLWCTMVPFNPPGARNPPAAPAGKGTNVRIGWVTGLLERAAAWPAPKLSGIGPAGHLPALERAAGPCLG